MRFLTPTLVLALAASLSAGAFANQKSALTKGTFLTVSYNGSSRSSNQARSALLTSMRNGLNIPVTAVITLNNVMGDECEYKIRLDQSKSGKMKRTILQPVSVSGVIQTDDGAQWRTYLVDENKMIVMPSPRNEFGDPLYRISLVDKNYHLKSTKGVAVAGRDTLLVTAQPKYAGMPVRRYYLDEDTKFMLRIELIDSTKRVRTLLDTQGVSFPVDHPDSWFRLDNLVPTPRIERVKPPQEMGSISQATKKLGFKPVLPESLPYGFTIHRPQIGGDEKDIFLALRISDGLARATVYQMKASAGGGARAPQGAVDGVWNNVRYRIMGDIPASISKKIIEAFLKQAGKGPTAHSETPAYFSLLSNSEEKMPHDNGADDLSGSNQSGDLLLIAWIEAI